MLYIYIYIYDIMYDTLLLPYITQHLSLYMPGGPANGSPLPVARISRRVFYPRGDANGAADDAVNNAAIS